MIKIGTFIHGIYPRGEKLVEISRGFDRDRFTQKELEARQTYEFRNFLRLQQKLGFDYLEDGKLSWQDIFRPIIEATDGLAVGSLTRWFDNNTFFRQPIFLGRLRLDSKKLDLFFPAVSPSSKWKVTLPSPYTFAKLCQNDTSFSFAKLLGEVTKLFADICNYLEKKGVSFIQFNEPYLPYYKADKEDLKLFISYLKKVVDGKKRSLKWAINFYFGDAAGIISSLSHISSLNIVGIDMYSTDISQLKRPFPYSLLVGVLEGRNSLLEDKKTLIKVTRNIIDKMNPSELYLSNNSDLELLPEEIARRKLKILAEVANQFK